MAEETTNTQERKERRHKEITMDMPLLEAFQVSPLVPEIFVNYGMSCLFCGVAGNETVKQACMGHGMSEREVEYMIGDINEFLENITPEEEAEARGSIFGGNF